MMTHRCNAYIEMLRARADFVETLHKYVCRRDDTGFPEDVNSLSLDQIKARVAPMRMLIGNDAVDEILARMDDVIDTLRAL